LLRAYGTGIGRRWLLLLFFFCMHLAFGVRRWVTACFW
jgi:hypothetical protein